uniref:Uncharacterized protein n=1 Tax=Panagrolaimus sp. ES5 TaxID=591445 RepID=A0AC34FXI7_9BILA
MSNHAFDVSLEHKDPIAFDRGSVGIEGDVGAAVGEFVDVAVIPGVDVFRDVVEKVVGLLFVDGVAVEGGVPLLNLVQQNEL